MKKERLQILIFPIIIRNRSCSYVFSIAFRFPGVNLLTGYNLS